MQNSKIEWTTHTFNPWWGCIRVSPGCEHCYAETLAHRYGYEVWGPAKTTGRRMMSDNYWRQPIKWNKAAQAAGTRARVFCASMADVFENHPQVEDARYRLWDLIEATPWLDWLLLTKRPENILGNTVRWAPFSAMGKWPDNVWIGTSVENQEQADKRIPELLKVPAKVRFLSCEPLLGPVDIADYLGCQHYLHGQVIPCTCSLVDWVIVGGESGHGSRAMHPEWARSLRDQCREARTAFFFKQWGNWQYVEMERDAQGRHVRGPGFANVGKHAAGRLLDGQEWNEMPL